MIATALEPIYLDVDLSVEEYDFELEEITEFDCDLETAIIINTITGDMYEGPYHVIPTFDDQELLTKDKTMREDVTVEPIPVSRTSNPAGGTTVYIGGNLNG